MENKKRKYWRKLKHRYKLTIFNELTYEEVMHVRLSPLQVLTALCTLAVVLISLTIILIAFTNLREFIPGYPSSEMRRQITLNALRVDSLTREMEKRDNYYRSIHAVLTGGMDTVRAEISPGSFFLSCRGLGALRGAGVLESAGSRVCALGVDGGIRLSGIPEALE